MSTINENLVFNGTNGFQSTVIGLNTASNYLLADFLLVAVFITLIFLLRNFESRDYFLSATVVTFLVSVMFWASGFTVYGRVILCFAGVVIAIAMSYFKD